MNSHPAYLRRRDLFASASAFSIAALSASSVTGSTPESSGQNVTSVNQKIPTPKISLNTSTLRGHKLTITQQIEVAAAADYDGIEPWMRDLNDFVKQGGNPQDLRKQLEDVGLEVSGAIGFAKWIVNDETVRQQGLDEAKRDMELVAAIGGTQMAAPPIGVHREKELEKNGPIDLETIARRYSDLLDVGDQTGVTPLLELWGFSPILSKLGELAYVATAAAHPSASMLPDFYHIYKGGNQMQSLATIEASRMPLFHINDYPDSPPIEVIADKDRVFPGDGVCELVPTISMLLRNGFIGTFSLELFNPTYWERPAQDVANEGCQKSRDVIAKAVEDAQSLMSR